MQFALIPETAGGRHRLGRHLEHDPRSRDYPAARGTVQSVTHIRHCPPYDQGELGSCTGNAMAGALMTDPLFVAGRNLTEPQAVELYELATKLDHVPGGYPPDDTGSTGLAVAKAAVKLRDLSSYTHAFGLEHALEALSLGPVIAGVGWYTSFDQPLATGECPLTADATVRGGHEVELFAIDTDQRQVWAYQSWGATWGGLKNGTFWWSYQTFERLLAEQGDVTAFVANR